MVFYAILYVQNFPEDILIAQNFPKDTLIAQNNIFLESLRCLLRFPNCGVKHTFAKYGWNIHASNGQI